MNTLKLARNLLLFKKNLFQTSRGVLNYSILTARTTNIDLKKCEANAEGIELRRYYAKKSKSKEFFLEDLF